MSGNLIHFKTPTVAIELWECSVMRLENGDILYLNTLRPRQDGCHFPDDIFKRIFFNENVSISINFSLKFVLRCPINNIPALVQIMAWRRPGDKPLSEPMMVSLPTHICVTRPQWVNIRNVPNYLTCRGPCPHTFEINSLGPSDTIAAEIWVNTGSGNGLLPDSTKPLPEPMLTYHQ